MSQALQYYEWDEQLSRLTGNVEREEALSGIEDWKPLPEENHSHLHGLGVFPVTPHLAIGRSPGICEVSALKSEGITHLFNLRLRPSPWTFIFRSYFQEVLHTPMEGSSSLLAFLPSVLFELHRIIHSSPEARVLVHCREGVARSATVVCAYLVMLGVPVETAQQMLRFSRPGARPYLHNLEKNETLMQRSAAIGRSCVHQVRSDILAKIGPKSWDMPHGV